MSTAAIVRRNDESGTSAGRYDTRGGHPMKLPVIGALPDTDHRGLPGAGDQRVLVTDPDGRALPGDAAPGTGPAVPGRVGPLAVTRGERFPRGSRPGVVSR